ncbi:MAG: DUF2807 domain-containing protein [Bacteroidales bacterium]|nr:DUF2807 domain-containing protein [Bacteroidales bacterium]
MTRQLFKTLIISEILTITATTYTLAQSTRTISNVAPFKKIVVASGINIILNQTGTREITVEGERTVISNVVCAVEDSTMSIYATRYKYSKSKKINVYIDFDSTLVDIVSTSGNRIKCETPLTGSKLSFVARNGSDFYIMANSLSINAKSISGSRIQLIGKADKTDLYAENGSDIHSYNLDNEFTSATATLSSHIECYASQRLDAWATYDSYIYYKGDPHDTNISTTVGCKVLPK